MPSSPAVGDDRDPDLSAAVRAAQEGDEDAFRVLYRAIQPGLIRYLWAQAGDAAEDIAAETWLRVARDLPRFQGDAAGFRGWVTSIGRHRVIDHLRYQGRHPQGGAPVELLAHLPAAENTEDTVLESLATASALEMIAGLPPTQAEAVLLTIVMELDSKTAGKIMGKRSGAVRVAAHRGLRRLAEQLGAGSGPAPEAASGAGDSGAADADTGNGNQANASAAGAAGSGRARGPGRTANRNVPQQRVTIWQATAVKDVR